MSQHILLPARYNGDGDKAVCGVRLSEKPGRTTFTHPREMTGEGCEKCYLKVLRSWQEKDPNIDPVPTTWIGWPWDHPPHVKYPIGFHAPHDVRGWKPE